MNSIENTATGGFRGLSGNTLKILALILMTIDHIGMLIFTQYRILRIIGRASFPIFAYMIAEGCKYTSNRRRYLLNIFLLGALYQVVYWFVARSLYMCIFITFTLSICTIYSIDFACKSKNIISWIVPILTIAGVWILCGTIRRYIPDELDYKIDYGFFGVMLPVLIYLPRDRWLKLIMAAAGIAALAFLRKVINEPHSSIQVWAFTALIPLALYNGERGKLNIKTLFYVYYPVHLIILELVSRFGLQK